MEREAVERERQWRERQWRDSGERHRKERQWRERQWRERQWREAVERGGRESSPRFAGEWKHTLLSRKLGEQQEKSRADSLEFAHQKELVQGLEQRLEGLAGGLMTSSLFKVAFAEVCTHTHTMHTRPALSF